MCYCTRIVDLIARKYVHEDLTFDSITSRIKIRTCTLYATLVFMLKHACVQTLIQF